MHNLKYFFVLLFYQSTIPKKLLGLEAEVLDSVQVINIYFYI